MAEPIMSVCRDGEELDSQGDASSQPDTISIASRTSQNTLDSDKVGYTHTHIHASGSFFQRHTENVPDNSLKIHKKWAVCPQITQLARRPSLSDTILQSRELLWCGKTSSRFLWRSLIVCVQGAGHLTEPACGVCVCVCV